MIVNIVKIGEKFLSRVGHKVLINPLGVDKNGINVGDRNTHITKTEEHLIVEMLKSDVGEYIFKSCVYSFLEDEYCSDIDINVVYNIINMSSSKTHLSKKGSCKLGDLLIYCIEEVKWIDYLLHKGDRKWIYIDVPWIVKNYCSFFERMRYCIK